MDYEQPEYSMTFDDVEGQVVNAASSDLNALTKKVLHSLNPVPVIGELPDTFIKLPAGLLLDNRVVREAEIQELTGEHEEKLAKARTSNNPAKYVSTLLQCGTVAIGDTEISTDILDSLLQGDLDMLMLGIRRATFGDEFELFGVACESCGESNDLTLNLKDIPVQELADPEVRDFLVDIRKGRKARVQFPTGAVQNDIFKSQLTIPEMNSLTLAFCVLSFIEPDGTERLSKGLSDVKKLGLADRKTLQDYIYNNQPGPRYDKVVAQCSSCEGEVLVPLNVGILFQEL